MFGVVGQVHTVKADRLVTGSGEGHGAAGRGMPRLEGLDYDQDLVQVRARHTDRVELPPQYEPLDFFSCVTDRLIIGLPPKLPVHELTDSFGDEQEPRVHARESSMLFLEKEPVRATLQRDI